MKTPKAPRDLILRLVPICDTPWDGREDDNVEFYAELASGRDVVFFAITPQNIIRLWQTSYSGRKTFYQRHMLIVRRIDEQCLWEAVEEWLDWQETEAEHRARE